MCAVCRGTSVIVTGWSYPKEQRCSCEMRRRRQCLVSGTVSRCAQKCVAASCDFAQEFERRCAQRAGVRFLATILGGATDGSTAAQSRHGDPPKFFADVAVTNRRGEPSGPPRLCFVSGKVSSRGARGRMNTSRLTVARGSGLAYCVPSTEPVLVACSAAASSPLYRFTYALAH
jgi:hypothetical protein